MGQRAASLRSQQAQVVLTGGGHILRTYQATDNINTVDVNNEKVQGKFTQFSKNAFIEHLAGEVILIGHSEGHGHRNHQVHIHLGIDPAAVGGLGDIQPVDASNADV